MDPRGDEWGTHHVPVDLIELHEILEWNGVLEIPRSASRRPLTARLVGAIRTAARSSSGPPLPLRFVSRAEWGARRPKYAYNSIVSTAQGNTCHYEGPHMGTFPHSSCPSKVRAIQNFHMGEQRGWNDVAYSSLVCPHGYIFEGRWYGNRTGANGTKEGNRVSYAHCALIGENDAATTRLLAGLQEVREYFEARGSGGRVWGHRDWKATACPGDPLYRFVKDWNWTTGSSGGSPPPTPTTPQEDDLVIAEMIKAMYNIARRTEKKPDYDVSIEDPAGYLNWLSYCYRARDPLSALNDKLAPALRQEAKNAKRGDVKIPSV